MKKLFKLDRNSIFILVLIALSLILFLHTNGLERALPGNSIWTKALVIGTDNSLLRQHGIIKTGGQKLKLKIMEQNSKGVY
jgi:hypothetical protein